MSSTPSQRGTTSTPSANSSSCDTIDATPLLSHSSDNLSATHNSRSFRDAARFIRRESSRRMMREPSVIVRETAAEQVEERQNDWAYSKPVVALDVVWNFALLAVAFTVLGLSLSERPSIPLRFWIFGYVLQCFLHVCYVVEEFLRRRRRRRLGIRVEGGGGTSQSVGSGSSESSGEQYVSMAHFDSEDPSHVRKYLESANTMFSFVWWIIGFFWVSTGGQALAHSSPRLYWLCIAFLGLDVFFVVLCVVLACLIGIAVCSCLPCIIAILYVAGDQDGASKEDIDQLAKYEFRKVSDGEKLAGDVQVPLGGIMTECGTDSPTERVLALDDVECCICLSAYEDGAELRELPCSHHFHCTCIDKWLQINAICPLCKYNILKNTSGREAV